jgi:uncharacterized membrane protein
MVKKILFCIIFGVVMATTGSVCKYTSIALIINPDVKTLLNSWAI